MMAGQSHYTPPTPEFDEAPSVLIVVAPYYKDITDGLLSGVRATADAAGTSGTTRERTL